MKFKTWVTATLLVLTALLILTLFFTDNILLNILSIISAGANVIILTKFSKICE